MLLRALADANYKLDCDDRNECILSSRLESLWRKSGADDERRCIHAKLKKLRTRVVEGLDLLERLYSYWARFYRTRIRWDLMTFDDMDKEELWLVHLTLETKEYNFRRPSPRRASGSESEGPVEVERVAVTCSVRKSSRRGTVRAPFQSPFPLMIAGLLERVKSTTRNNAIRRSRPRVRSRPTVHADRPAQLRSDVDSVSGR